MANDRWFSDKYQEFKDDPEYIAEELALDIVLRLGRRMRDLNLNQSELARRIGTSPAFVSQVLHGKPNLTLLTLAKLSVALNLECSITLQNKAYDLGEYVNMQSKTSMVVKPGDGREQALPVPAATASTGVGCSAFSIAA